jgi:acyl transferase domain-containing protein
MKTLTGHLEGTAGLAGLLLAHVALNQRFAHGLRYRDINPYVANSFGGWEVPHRLPLQSAACAAANAGTSSFGMSGVNAHAIITPPADDLRMEGALELAFDGWQRSLRCYVEVLVPLHPLLHKARKAGRQQIQFRLPLSRPVLAFLWDHQVQSAAIMPGAAYFEMAAAAACTLLKLAQPTVALTGAAIAAPLRLPPAAAAAAVEVTAEMALDSGEVSICSRPTGSTFSDTKEGSKAPQAAPSQTLHLRGSLTAVRPASFLPKGGAVAAVYVPSADAVRAACSTPLDTAAVYRGLQSAGLQYGAAFRQLRGIQQGLGSAAAGLHSSGGGSGPMDADVSGFMLHPALLDGCLQLGALVPEAEDGGSEIATAAGGAYVPASLAAYLIHQPVQQGRQPLAIVRRSPEAFRKSVGATYRDHCLLTPGGALLAVLDGLEAKQLPGSGAARPGAAKAFKQQQSVELLYEVAWQAAVVAADIVPVVAGAPSTTTLALPSRTAELLASVSSSLAVMQGALEQQVGALQLATVADCLPGSVTASHAGVPAGSGSALWGMLRSFAQEAPAVNHGGELIDALAAAGSNCSITLAASTTSKSADGYGSAVRAGAAMNAVLLPSSTVRAASAPYHLMPMPRGAFR